MPLGAIVATARLVDCVPMCEWRDAANVVGREVNHGDGWEYPPDVDRSRTTIVPDRRAARRRHVKEGSKNRVWPLCRPKLL